VSLECSFITESFIAFVQIFENSTADASRPAIWIDAGIHAREWIAITTAVYFIRQVRIRPW